MKTNVLYDRISDISFYKEKYLKKNL